MPSVDPIKTDAHLADATNGGLPGLQGPPWRRGVLLVLLTVVVAALAASDSLHTALIGVFAGAGQIMTGHPVIGAAVFVLLAALSAMLAFVSAAVIMPAAILAWGVPLSLALLWLGWILGGACAYSIGRWAGRPALRWIKAGALDRLEAQVRRNASFGMVLLIQLALPSELPGYVLGLVRYRIGLYLAALALAELPFAATAVYVGAGLVERRGAQVLSWGMTLAILSVGALYLLRRRMGRLKEAGPPPG